MTANWISYLGLGLAVFGIPFTFVVSRYFANRRALCWYYRERKVLDPVGGEFPDGIQLFFDGVEVPQLSEWNIGLWNSGNQSLTKSDIVRALTFTFDKCRVIKLSEASPSREGVSAQISQIDENNCSIEFHFLDPSDGLVFTIYTTGDPKEGEEYTIDISGTVIGIPNGPNRLGRMRNWDTAQILTGIFVGIFTIAAPIALITYGLTYLPEVDGSSISGVISSIKSGGGKDQIAPIVAGLVIGLIYIPVGVLIIYNSIAQMFNSIPNNVKQLADNPKIAKIRNPFTRAMVESMIRTTELLRIK